MPAAIPQATAYRRALAALAGEWIKLRSLRSVPMTLLAATVFCIGLAVLVCSNYHTRWATLGPQRQAAFNPTDTSLGFLQVAMLFFGVLGALTVTNEYGSGLIRTTFAATPQRFVVLAAKVLLLGTTVLVASTLTVGAAFLAGQGRFTGPLPHTGLGDPAAARAVAGGALYLTLVGVFGLFIGVLTRSTALAVSTLFGIFLVLPVMVNSLPHGVFWRHTVPYLPSNLGVAMWHSPVTDLTRPATAAILLAGYVLALGAAGAAVLRKRDA